MTWKVDGQYYDVDSIRRMNAEIQRLRMENARLGLAFHHAINSPKGVVPHGFDDFYEQEHPALRDMGK